MSISDDGSLPELPRHPGRHRGNHAAPPTPLRQLVRSLLAVAVVAAFVALLLEWRGSPSSSADPNPAAVVSPSVPATGSPTATPSTRPSPVATPTRVKPTSPPRVKLTLTVLNNSRVTNLADRSAAEFRARGWPVGFVGNLRGYVIPVTTVYYAEGNDRQRVSARWLRQQFPDIERLRERFDGLPGEGLVVVLTGDYPA